MNTQRKAKATLTTIAPTATAMLLSGIEAFLTLAIGIIVLIQEALNASIPVFNGGFVLALLGSGFVTLLLVIAFGLGLGDASGRIRGQQSQESNA